MLVVKLVRNAQCSPDCLNKCLLCIEHKRESTLVEKDDIAWKTCRLIISMGQGLWFQKYGGCGLGFTESASDEKQEKLRYKILGCTVKDAHDRDIWKKCRLRGNSCFEPKRMWKLYQTISIRKAYQRLPAQLPQGIVACSPPSDPTSSLLWPPAIMQLVSGCAAHMSHERQTCVKPSLACRGSLTLSIAAERSLCRRFNGLRCHATIKMVSDTGKHKPAQMHVATLTCRIYQPLWPRYSPQL